MSCWPWPQLIRVSLCPGRVHLGPPAGVCALSDHRKPPPAMRHKTAAGMRVAGRTSVFGVPSLSPRLFHVPGSPMGAIPAPHGTPRALRLHAELGAHPGRPGEGHAADRTAVGLSEGLRWTWTSCEVSTRGEVVLSRQRQSPGIGSRGGCSGVGGWGGFHPQGLLAALWADGRARARPGPFPTSSPHARQLPRTQHPPGYSPRPIHGHGEGPWWPVLSDEPNPG